MVMSLFWYFCSIVSAFYAIFFHRGSEISSALMEGAANAVTVSIAIAGPLSLWSGIGNLMEHLGVTASLGRVLSPILGRLFPSSRHDERLAGSLSGNVCANLLGLGNAATPMGIQAVKRLQDPANPQRATDEMCRLVVMNTASIQLIPTTVSVLRAAEGCATPFDILPCVWVTSLLSVTAGLSAAALFRRVWRDL